MKAPNRPFEMLNPFMISSIMAENMPGVRVWDLWGLGEALPKSQSHELLKIFGMNDPLFSLILGRNWYVKIK